MLVPLRPMMAPSAVLSALLVIIVLLLDKVLALRVIWAFQRKYQARVSAQHAPLVSRGGGGARRITRTHTGGTRKHCGHKHCASSFHLLVNKVSLLQYNRNLIP